VFISCLYMLCLDGGSLVLQKRMENWKDLLIFFQLLGQRLSFS
jgi:hypothetical protein